MKRNNKRALAQLIEQLVADSADIHGVNGATLSRDNIRVDAELMRAVESFSSLRADAGETVFFARELEYIKALTYDIKYPNLKATQVIPVSTEAGAGAETITYTSYNQVGMARILANYADDLPRADVKGEQFTANVRGIGTSYGYSIQDIRAAQMAGKPLQTRRAESARKANDILVNKIGFFGDATHGLLGLLTHPNVPVYVLPADGTDNSTRLRDKTPTQCLRDLNGMVQSMIRTTKGVETPNTMLLPPDTIAWLRSTPRSDVSDTTIAEFFLDNNGYIEELEDCVELQEAGPSGGDMIVCYRKDPNALTFEIPQPFEQFPPQQEGLEFEIPCHSRCGGVIIYYPLSLVKAEGA
ncbi:MAG: DUF2184 domain-containing protein [Paraburkholderia sp.]|jgi:hypothetical protein|nr:DUF2184 domain-containing protein [Paraburkholderia sp.]